MLQVYQKDKKIHFKFSNLYDPSHSASPENWS